MSRRAVAMATAATVLVVVAAVIVIIRVSGPDEAAQGISNDRSPEDVASYWTTERMRRASPG
ncbi:hypothetical protein ACFOY2_29350 [Nonomuraea purpurea]|uniref:Uncharacterized protein n=1 Tax=Nonomuraea purpurea TaxID=1849276 RepID=A0ABV8GG66_9ACTN